MSLLSFSSSSSHLSKKNQCRQEHCCLDAGGGAGAEAGAGGAAGPACNLLPGQDQHADEQFMGNNRHADDQHHDDRHAHTLGNL